MIDVSFPMDGTECQQRMGTAKCHCVKGILHETYSSEPHICRCGAQWTTTKQKDQWNRQGIVTSVIVGQDYDHPHEEFWWVDENGNEITWEEAQTIKYNGGGDEQN